MGDEERAEDDDDVVVEQGGGGHHELQPTDDLQQLRQRKDELTQKHLDQQHRKQQLKVLHLILKFYISFSCPLNLLSDFGRRSYASESKWNWR